MLLTKREMLMTHLLALPGLVDAHAAHDGRFVDMCEQWLSDVEQTLGRLRLPAVGLASACRSRLVAAREGLTARPAGERPSRTKTERATAISVLAECESALRGIVGSVDDKLDGLRERMAQLVAIAYAGTSLPRADPVRHGTTWLREIWTSLAQRPEVSQLHTYLGGSMGLVDALSLLGEVLDNADDRHE